MSNRPNILYIFAGNRSEKFRGTMHEDFPDTQFYGLNHLGEFGIDAEYKELEDFWWGGLLAPIISFNLRHILMYFATFGHDVVFGSSLLKTAVLKKLFGSRAQFILLNISLTRFIENNKRNAWRMRIIRALFSEIDAVVCLSEVQRSYLKSHNLLPPDRIHTIPLGVDLRFYTPVFEDRNNVILSVGRDNGRDYRTLIEAARLLPDRQFIIVCSRRNMVGIRDIPHNVTVYYDISITCLKELYASAQLLVLPIYEHTRGADCSGQTVLLDAMASGLPVIVTDAEWVSEYAQPDNDVLCTRPEDPTDVVAKIQQLGDENVRNRIARNARDRVEEIWNTRNMARQLTKVFLKYEKRV